GGMQSAVQAWMAVVIIAREFVVSAVRGYSESCGVKFPATYAGKIKMFVQSFAICTILCQLANLPDALWAVYVKVICVWLAVAVTVVSGLAYVGKARALLVANE
ncbi:MAG: CDP-diacylglycerol--glycerol-3-phosphate 3-phosphatidyltransferase, partial [Phycisphaerae bacterium]|nr:CDP-diacylglycerol--glycerol-3-phosphate 3-phosphatidyltransferase [Phycisphaerae bacterium]